MNKESTFLAILWLLLAMPVHAQQSPMVQCRIGARVSVVPDYMCNAYEHAAAKVASFPDWDWRPDWGILSDACVAELAQYLDAPTIKLRGICVPFVGHLRLDHQLCRSRGNC